jgi:hypothetical protein
LGRSSTEITGQQSFITFRQIGISLNLDGSEDSEIKIRDVPDIEVGDWRRADGPINLDGMDLP